MDQILLNAETKIVKEKLLDMVDALVVRQNLMQPQANFEAFLTETAARKVLKELLGEFNNTVNDLRDKTNASDEKTRSNKKKIETQELQIKSVVQTVKDVVTFSKRLAVIE